MELSTSELILNPDGSVYHLNLLPGELADTIILVGDPNRVSQVSKYFDRIDVKKSKREFVTHTGYVGKRHLSVVGTGIGAGNIDIVMNECDALMNIDLHNRMIKSDIRTLRFIRLGTCGGLDSHIPVDSYIVSAYAIGLDGLMRYYLQPENEDEKKLLALCQEHFASTFLENQMYVAQGSENLIQLFQSQDLGILGMTMTCSGFYAPQHRVLRAQLSGVPLFSRAQKIRFQNYIVTNFEMETAAIYGLSRALGHEACSISVVVANRTTKAFSNQMDIAMDQLIQRVLEIACNLLSC